MSETATVMGLSRLGWGAELEQEFARHAAAGLVPGRVAVQHRGAYDVYIGQGEVRAAMLHGDAAGDKPGGRVLLEFLFQFGSPAEPGKPQDRCGLGQRETPFALVRRALGRAHDRQSARSPIGPRADAKSSVVMNRTSSCRG